MNPRESSRPTLLLAGGGLANGLIALKLAETHPDTRIVLFEAGDTPGGNHTWSFHANDLDDEGHRLMAPLVAYRWDAQKVQFPDYQRTLDQAYLTTHSDALAERLAATPAIEQRCNARVLQVEPNAVVLEDGERIEGSATIDGRGPGKSTGMVLGFQKFLGHEIRTAEPHGVTTPVIMDATVSQQDGYRFVYVLPLTEDRLLVEDTYYSEAGDLSREALVERIDAYIADRGWRKVERVREEHGVLPILMAGDFNQFWPRHDPVARAGLRAGGGDARVNGEDPAASGVRSGGAAPVAAATARASSWPYP
ncbi:MAG: lycopene beta-cyclase CrtY, partial [Wenzhouxiangellaceae bacterium]